MDGKNTAGENTPTAPLGVENVNGTVGTGMAGIGRGEGVQEGVVRTTVLREEGAGGREKGRGRGVPLCAGDRDRGTEKEEHRQTGGRVEGES